MLIQRPGSVEDEPVQAGCPCDTCRRCSRGYLRHLASLREPVAATLSWSGDEWGLSWPSEPDGLYRIEHSPDLGSWTILAEATAEDSVTTRPLTSPQGFYRILRLVP